MRRKALFYVPTILSLAIAMNCHAATPGPSPAVAPSGVRGRGAVPPAPGAARGGGSPLPGRSSAPAAPKDPATQYYEAILADYMAGKWDDLAARLDDPAHVAALSREQKDDLAYIKSAMAECRPDWWEIAKAGKPATFPVTVWGKQFTIHFKHSDHLLEPVAKGDGTYDEAWPSEMMDDNSPLQTTLGPSRDFTEANGVNYLIWGALADTRKRLIAADQKIPPVPADKRSEAHYFTRFHMALAAAYFGKPRDRAHELYQAAISMRGRTALIDEYIGRVPVAMAVQLAMIVNPKPFQSFSFIGSGPPALFSPSAHVTSFIEETLSDSIRFKYSFAADRALREAIKSIAAANDDQRIITGSGLLSLPAGQTFNLDLKAQNDASNALWIWESYFKQFNGLNLRPPRAPRAEAVAPLVPGPPPRAGQAFMPPPQDFADSAKALYMSGDWNKLDELLKTAPAADSLPAPQQESLSYIRKAIAEGRPPWITALKPGAIMPLKISLWGQTFDANFTEKKYFEFVEAKTPQISWPLDRPADKNPVDAAGALEFTGQERSDITIWQMAEAAQIIAGWPGKVPTSGDAVERFGGYMLFREDVTAAYYAKPRDRSWIFYDAMDSLLSYNQPIPRYAALSPLVVSLLLDMVHNPKDYPSFHVRPKNQVNRGPSTDLEVVNNFFEPTAADFDKFKYTFEEDKRLREIAKKLADDNANADTVMKAGAVKLPDGTMFTLWPRAVGGKNDPIYTTLTKELKDGPLAGVQFRTAPTPPEAGR